MLSRNTRGFSLIFSGYWWRCPSVIKRPRREAHYSTVFNAEVRNEWSDTSMACAGKTLSYN